MAKTTSAFVVPIIFIVMFLSGIHLSKVLFKRIYSTFSVAKLNLFSVQIVGTCLECCRRVIYCYKLIIALTIFTTKGLLRAKHRVFNFLIV